MGRRQPDVTRVQSALAGPPASGLRALRHLRWFGVLLPVVAITALHLVRPHLVAAGHPLATFDHVLRGLALALGLTAFYLLDRAYRLVLQRNRELAAINTVGAAVRGSTDVDEIASAAVRALTRSTGARHAALTWDTDECQESWEHGVVVAEDRTLDVPLRAGRVEIGRLTVRGLRGVSPATLVTIGEHVGSAMHRARLVADLMRAERQAATVDERERIAREMHDSLAQVLGITHLRLLSVCARPGLPADVADDLSELVGICHDAYIDVREGILGLREASRPERSLAESLGVYVAKFSRQSRIVTTLRTDGQLDLGPQAEIQIIRVIQEALTNIRKHSGAHAADVTIRAEEDHIVFDVSDDGRGFDPAALGSGGERFGLHSMRERTELLGGRFNVRAAPGRGTRVRAVVPRPAVRRSEVLT